MYLNRKHKSTAKNPFRHNFFRQNVFKTIVKIIICSIFRKIRYLADIFELKIAFYNIIMYSWGFV